MNPGLVVKLRPAGPWRIGPDSGARNRVDVIYHSDSLYSAVTSTMSRMGSLAAWLDATARSQAPAVCFSSCFPFLDDIAFVVPPRTLWPPTSPAAMSARVRWKSARFIPLTVVESILAGERLNENQWSVDGASACLVPAGKPGPFRTSIRWNAAVDRLSGASERHSTACIEFREGCGLWTVIGFRDDAARDQWQEPVKAAFRWLADSGFGGERSRGWGRSLAPEFVEGTLPGLILEYKDREPAPPIEEPPSEEPPVEEPPPTEEPVPDPNPPMEAETSETATPEVGPSAESAPEAEAAAPPVEAEAATPEPVPPAESAAEVEAAAPSVEAEGATPEVVPPAESAAEVEAAAPSVETEGATPEVVPPAAPSVEAEAATPEAVPPVESAPEAEAVAPSVEAEAARPEPEPPAESAREAEAAVRAPDRTAPMRVTPEPEDAPAIPAVHLQAHWLLSLFTPAAADGVDWGRGSYTVLARGGRIDSPSGSGELKKQIQMVAEGSVLYADGVPLGSAADVAPDGFAHPVFRAGFALSIPLPEVH